MAVAKGVRYVDDNTIEVTLIEENATLVAEDTFAVNRTISFTKDANGNWSGKSVLGTGTYDVTGWVTPKALP